MKHFLKNYRNEIVPRAILFMLMGGFAAIAYYYVDSQFYTYGIIIIENDLSRFVLLLALSLAVLNMASVYSGWRLHPLATWMFRPVIMTGAWLLGAFVYFVIPILTFSYVIEGVDLRQLIIALALILLTHFFMCWSALYGKEEVPDNTNRRDSLAPEAGL